MRKIMISVAPIAYFDKCVDVAEISRDIVECCDAGAVLAHLHSYAADGAFDPDAALFNRIVKSVRDQRDMIIQASLGNIYEGVSMDEMFRPLDNPYVTNTTFTAGSFNIDDHKCIVSAFDEMQLVRDLTIRKGVSCEYQIAQPEMISNIKRLDKEKTFIKPDMYNIVVGHPGSPPNIKYLVDVVDRMPKDAIWGVTHLHREGDYAMLIAGIILGADFIRVGLEDSPWLSDGVKVEKNVDLVKRAAELINMCGHEVATIEDARALVGCYDKK